MKHSITTQGTTQQKALLAPRARGYRIIVYRGYGRGPSQHLPVIFAQGIPARWDEIKADTSVTQAILIRSGRKFSEYRREGVQCEQ